MHQIGANVVRTEADALRALADRLAGPMAASFGKALNLLFACKGRVVVTGMGKSGIIGRKIAATLSSTGTPAMFLRRVEKHRGNTQLYRYSRDVSPPGGGDPRRPRHPGEG